MKKQKVCALLCIAALSTATITPAMAADNTADAQVTTESSVTNEEQPASNASDATGVQGESSVDASEKTDAPAQEEQSGTMQQTKEGQETETVQGTENTAVSNEQTIENAEVNEDASQEEVEVPENGWYQEPSGWYYYENGEKITSEIVEIEDEDGNKYGYYFDNTGAMVSSQETWVYCKYQDGESEEWDNVYIKADANGHLYKGWDTSWDGDRYYGDNYTRYYDEFLEDGDTLYYFDDQGILVKNQEIVIDDVNYKADENGALSVVDTKGKTGWVQSGEVWYYYKDGKILKDTFEDINGIKYHFDYDGEMSTGTFWVDNFGYLAEPNGQIVKAKGWYHSEQTKKWYWFDSKGEVKTSTLLDLQGVKYYLNYNGEMQTGVFEASYYEKEEWINKIMYEDASGAISSTPGWKLTNGCWYYVGSDGSAVRNEIKEIGGKKYSFDWDGQMRTGKFDVWDGEKSNTYYADNTGAIITNKWTRDKMDWYYADKEGKIVENQWINDTYYVTDDGSMAVGVTEIEDKTYVFDENGHKEMILEDQKDGWHLADGDWYYVKDGKLETGWLNSTYYLEEGRMVTNQSVPAEHLEDRESYVDENGHMKSGWVQNMNDWMYLEKDSKTGDVVAFQKGWKQIAGVWYYFSDDFMISNDVLEIDGRLSQFAKSGAWEGYVDKQGWKQLSTGEWYYVNADGKVNTKEKKTINGATYYFEMSGIMLQNTTYYDEKESRYYWINNNGNLDISTGWKKYHSTGWNNNSWTAWYYVENGKLVTGEKKINGIEYCFSGYGRMYESETYYNSDNEKWFLIDENGKKIDVSRTGWYQIREDGENVWYYFQNGQPYDGELGNYLIVDGRMVTGTFGRSNSVYLFDDSGILQKNGWKLYKGTWYYAGSTGRLYTGERNIGGKKYWFDPYSGEWLR